MTWDNFALFLMVPVMGGVYLQLMAVSTKIAALTVEVEHLKSSLSRLWAARK